MVPDKGLLNGCCMLQCQEQGCHVDESLYPHTFNPTLSLVCDMHFCQCSDMFNGVSTVLENPAASKNRGFLIVVKDQ